MEQAPILVTVGQPAEAPSAASAVVVASAPAPAVIPQVLVQRVPFVQAPEDAALVD